MYKAVASDWRSAIYSHNIKREDKIIQSNNINKFFHYANRKFTTKSPVGPLKSFDGSLVVDPTLKAELLQAVFSANFTNDNGIIPAVSSPIIGKDRLNSVLFSTALVKRAISKLKVKSKGGPDGVPPIFIKKCSSQLSTPLAYLFSQCMEYTYMPPDWLRAYITPVFKKGDSTSPLNYRPIALTCSLCKIMESVIKDQLLNYLLRKDLISKHQQWFLKQTFYYY